MKRFNLLVSFILLVSPPQMLSCSRLHPDVDLWDDDETNWPLFIQASYDADVVKMRELLTTGANIDSANSDGWTALKVAVKKQNRQTVLWLLGHCANPNLPDFKAITPLIEACENNDTNTALALIVFGANVNKAGPNNWTPLMSAACRGDLRLVKLLVDNHANVNVRHFADSASALDQARWVNNPAIVNYLIKSGAK